MIYDYGGGIYGIDALYEGQGFAQVYILHSGGRAAVIETAHNASLPHIISAMEKLAIKQDDVDFVCVTHVHLDHAGGAGSYMREFPNARLLVHPRGARHMADPRKLVEGVHAVYGPEETARLYGEIIPVPEERITAPQDGDEFRFGSMALSCFDAPGHAKHHMIFMEKSTGALFAGDAFGISYPWMSGSNGQWVFPTASPVQFSPYDMAATVKRITSLNPSSVYLTHFGPISDIDAAAAQLTKEIWRYADTAEKCAGDKERIKAALAGCCRKQAEEYGCGDGAAAEKLLAVDLELNSQGLAFWYKQKQAGKQP